MESMVSILVYFLLKMTQSLGSTVLDPVILSTTYILYNLTYLVFNLKKNSKNLFILLILFLELILKYFPILQKYLEIFFPNFMKKVNI